MKRQVFLPFLLFCCLASKAPAPIYGIFDGLNKLIDEAEFIAVAEIVKRPDEFDMGSGGIFEIDVRKVLKGNVKENQHAKAYLRDLGFAVPQHDIASLTNEFIQG